MKSEVQNEQYQEHKKGKQTDDQRNATNYCILMLTHYVITWTWACMRYMGALNSVVMYLVHKRQTVIKC
jgi:hypothetical protein